MSDLGDLNVEQGMHLKRLKGVRDTVARLVRGIHVDAARARDELQHGVSAEDVLAQHAHLVERDVEAVYAVALEAYRRGVDAMHAGMHRSEGVDHEMLDQAMQYANAPEGGP